MMVGSTTGYPGKFRRTEFTILTMFLSCCMMFSSALYAQAAEETEAPSAETTAIEKQAGEKTGAEPAKNDSTAAGAPDGAEKTETAAAQKPAEEGPTKLEIIQKKNKKCLMCHRRDKTRLLEDGTEMSIQVHRDDYLASAHGEKSCTSCHRAIGKRKHPSKTEKSSISSQRDYSVEMNENCKRCHKKKHTQYKNSVHAVLVAQGNPEAPVCTDCHSAHAVEPMADYRAETGFPCKSCHETIYNAYSDSVHGQARQNGNTIRDSHIQSPICSDCHESHQITALAIGDVLRTTCIGAMKTQPCCMPSGYPMQGRILISFLVQFVTRRLRNRNLTCTFMTIPPTSPSHM